jgi:hypothetical protein
MSDRIGNTEALEGYLKLERENKELSKELALYKEELEKMRKAYSSLSKEIATLYNWLTNRDKTKSIRRRMAEIFKFAYMENDFEDMKAEWPINKSALLDISIENNPSEVHFQSSKEGKTE